MKKILMIMLAVAFVGITLVIAADEQTQSKEECKKVCINASKYSYEICKDKYYEERDICKVADKICKNDTKIWMDSCSEVKANRTEFKECTRVGNENKKLCARTHKECDKVNRGIFLGCLREARISFEVCSKICKDKYMTEKECKKTGGAWNPCASPCEGEEICTQECVPGCEYKPCDVTEDCKDVGLKKYNCIDGKCVKGLVA